MSTEKKYAAIAASLGWTEYEVKEDGLFLQPEEANTLDAALAAGTQAAADLATSSEKVTELNATITGLQTTIDTAATETTKLNNRITELEAEVKTLGGKESGSGTVVATKEDPKPEEGKKIGLLDPAHPLNVAAKRKVEASKAKKK